MALFDPRFITLADTSVFVYRAIQYKRAAQISVYNDKDPLAGPAFFLMRTLQSLVHVYHPVIWVLDGYPKHKFEMYSNYQKKDEGGREQNRNCEVLSECGIEPTQEAFRQLKNQVQSLIATFPSMFARSATNQADDTIATIIAKNPGKKFRVLTKDKDLLALASKDVIVVLLPKGGGVDEYDDAKFIAKHGIRPDQLPLLKAWNGKGVGAGSDNLKGVYRLRTKMIKDCIIQDTDDFEQSLVNMESMKSVMNKTKTKWYDACHSHIDTARMNFKLASLAEDINDIEWYEYPGNQALLDGLWKRYRFNEVQLAPIWRQFENYIEYLQEFRDDYTKSSLSNSSHVLS